MAQKAVTIYTPTGSTPHITAEDDAFIHDALLGSNSGSFGNLVCTRVDDNTVRLSGGGVSNRGYILYVPAGDTCDLTIATGTQGMSRHDIIASRFVRGGGTVADTHEFVAVQGEASSAPSDPTLTHSTLVSSGDVNEVALFRVIITGTAITAIERLEVAKSEPRITVSETAPESPREGDLWFW